MDATHPQTVVDPAYPLYDSRWEHDACGTGFLARLSGEASHELVQTSLDALARLTHRGAQDADAETFDGCGLLTQLPRDLFCSELAEAGIVLENPDLLAAGMFFLPSSERSPEAYQRSRQLTEQVFQEAGLRLLQWRTPPCDFSIPGTRARAILPTIAQALLVCPENQSSDQAEQELYHTRRVLESRLHEAGLDECYIASLSRSTIVYKGLLAPRDLARFYLDLANPRYVSALAVFHQRYSTNSFPAWRLAQPMRLLAHNGEINTLRGNLHWMQAREASFESPAWGERVRDLVPVVQLGEQGAIQSDSAQIDNVLELLVRSGRDLLHSMQMLVPPAWEHDISLDSAQRAWCEYHAALSEPWDGPAALVFSDGRFVGAALDRNGLRPARYTLTSDGLLILASEAGVVPCEPEKVVEHGRLGPGQMLVADVEQGLLLHNATIKTGLSQRQSYQRWLDDHLQRLDDLMFDAHSEPVAPPEPAHLFERQQLFGLSNEDLEMVLRPILQDQKEPTWSMGDDAPLAALSVRSPSLSDYFRQRFAQVTNPPIDPLRERVVTSLDVYLGRRLSLLTETPEHARLLHLSSPLLTEEQLARLQMPDQADRSVTLSTCFDTASGTKGFEAALDQLVQDALDAVAQETTLLILSDHDATPDRGPLPMLIALGAVHRTLVEKGLRTQTSLICETGLAWDVHQIALLLGYGAEALTPTLALASVRALAGERKLEDLTPAEAVERYFHAIEDGLRKVMSRMGISTIRNIIGAAQFDAVGLAPELVERCFAGSALQPGNVTLATIATQETARLQALNNGSSEPETALANARKRKLPERGRYRFRRDGEYHAYNPFIIRALQKAAQSGSTEDYQQYIGMVYQRPPTALRDLFSFAPTTPIPLDEVEPMEAIRARFVISAMSVGAISPETHRTIAAAMNSIGGRNNTGEGGEDPAWYEETLEGYSVSSKIKQVASARFGVTTEYLVRAEEIEIKMAQGSKPGEGGQLPPSKVTPFIARLRKTEPGVSLISPPPHHDIYSIEDLAQLIFDLRQVNPLARIGVKLVSSIGVGTIAAGVAKAHANYVLISGHDGGTGASPLHSIKHAGMPWERGLAETQQVLLRNGLRQRVKVRVDGGFKTGRDVIVGALLGAEEFGFGTAALVSLGCDMARQCHLNTCPTGIATQREDLRAKFTGQSQHLINYLTLVAEEVRTLLAQLGFKRLEELVGRADLLQASGQTALDLDSWLVAAPGHFQPEAWHDQPRSALSELLLEEAQPALEASASVVIRQAIHNDDRTIGAGLAGEIARRYGNTGLPGVSVTCAFDGAAGQSFGAFNVSGMRLMLRGEANDYVGKSMTGGQISIAPPVAATFVAQDNTLLGNTVLYGATGGQLFAAGQAGERFAVRNSGALAVVEGIGDHGCEYMTGGMVVVLGGTGRNFAAGMSAGVAYVLDQNGDFPMRCNPEYVEFARIDDSNERKALREVIQWHHHQTHSKQAKELLENWEQFQGDFWRVQPYNIETTACDFVDASVYNPGHWRSIPKQG